MANLDNAINLIKNFEGLRLKAYLCPAGIQTIGYGATGPGIVLGLQWTKQQAIDDLEKRVNVLFDQVSHLLSYDMDDNQLCALIDFAYNLGIPALKSSTLLKKVNANLEDGSEALQFLPWCFASGRALTGIRTRRICEYILYTENRIASNDECASLIPKYYAK